MASGTPCLNSRWDRPKSKADVPGGAAGTHISAARPPGPPEPGAHAHEPPQGGVEMAAAMAAKINAMLMAKGKLKPLQPLPSKAPPCAPQLVSSEEVVVTEVDINDVPVNCRNRLTSGKTQEEIQQVSGAAVSTKGLYLSGTEKFSGTGVERPLYLQVQGRTQEEVNKAVMRIKAIISEDVLRASGGQQPAVMPPVPVYPQPPRPAAPVQPLRPHLPNAATRSPNTPVTPAHRPPPPHSGSFVHTKIFVGLDQSLPSFNVNESVEGPSGSYLQHIQTETGARVFLRGKGSGYIEQASRRESFEPLYLYISHPNSAGLEAAKKLCESLLETVRTEHARMLSVYTATGSTQASCVEVNEGRANEDHVALADTRLQQQMGSRQRNWPEPRNLALSAAAHTSAHTAYPAHGYSSSSSSYSGQSWYGYPANGYASAYPSYPAAGGYWNRASGPSAQTTANTPTQGMVQYPVCPRQSSTFLLQDESGVSSSIENPSSSPPDSKRHFLEDSEEEKEDTVVEQSDQSPEKEPELGAEDSGNSDGVLMPPPCVPLLPTVRKRQRETELSALSHTGHKEKDEDEAKKLKVSDSSGLVPYGGDSSDEEEERTHSVRKNST